MAPKTGQAGQTDQERTYQLYLDAFRGLDTNNDAHVDQREGSTSVDRFDVNGDKKIQLWEYFQRHNEAAGLKLFSHELIAELKEAYGLASQVTVQFSEDESAREATTWHAIEVIRILNKRDYPKHKTVEFLKLIAKKTGDSRDGAFEVVSVLLTMGGSPAQIASLLEMIDLFVKEDEEKIIGSALEQLPHLYRVLSQAGLHRDQIFDFLEELAKKETKRLAKVYQLLGKVGHHATPKDLRRFKLGFDSLLEGLKEGDLDLFVETVENIDHVAVDPTQINDRRSFAHQMALGFNQVYQGTLPSKDKSGGAKKVAVLINHFHDHDRSDDLIRATVIDQLSDRVLYLITSVGGPDLYPSTFLNHIYARRIKRNPHFIETIKKEDPENRHLTDLILTLAGFQKFWEVFRRNPNFFMEGIEALLTEKNADKLLVNVYLLLKMLGSLLKSKQYIAEKRRVEALLLDGYRNAKDASERKKQLIYGYVVQLYEEDFSDRATSQLIARDIPPIQNYVPKVLPEWSTGPYLQAELDFYEEEHVHFDRMRRTYRTKGFRVLKDKGNRRNIMTRNYNANLTLRVVTHLRPNDSQSERIGALMDDPSVLMPGHRGHSFRLMQTLTDKVNGHDKNKVIFACSCGSFRDLPKLLPYYSGNFFILDEDIGRGNDNNHVLLYLLEALAGGVGTWGEIRQYIDKKLRRYLNRTASLQTLGILLPDDPSFVLMNYVMSG